MKKDNRRKVKFNLIKITAFLLAMVFAAESATMPVQAVGSLSVSENGIMQDEGSQPEEEKENLSGVDGEEAETGLASTGKETDEGEYPDLDYIKGRPLTEEEKAQQEALVPDLKEIQVPDIAFDLPKTQEISPYLRRAGQTAVYDPRTLGAVTGVKNQGSADTCWAFTTIAAIEQAAIIQGLAGSSADYSENHLSYFLYNRNTDPLGGTEGDCNYVSAGYNYLSNGGNLLMAAFQLATWSGVVNESIAPYTGTQMAVSAAYEYYSDLKIKNIYFIGSNSDESLNVTVIKDAIENYGAVGVMYGHYSQYYNMDTAAYCNSGTDVNHAVVLVGWDDTYNKDNFPEVSRPENNGAFIAKNSWGSSWGDGGFFYLSYEDASICLPVAYEMMAADTYQNNYQYDGSVSLNYWSIPSGGQIGNIFTVAENENGYGENIRAVQLSFQSTNVNYSIQVYKNVTGTTDPTNGTPVLSEPVTGTTSMAGIYTIDLGQDIFVGCKESYGVVVTLTSDNASAVNVFGELSQSGGWIFWTAATKQGQSFYRSTTTRSWTDASMLQASSGGEVQTCPSAMRLKVFTNDTTTVTPGYIKPEPSQPAQPQAPTTTVTTPTVTPKPVQPQTPVSLSKVSVKKIANKTYTGKAIKPAPVLTYNNTTLVKNKDYTLSYKNNKKTGKATVTITGKGNYTGKKTVYFYIVPKKECIKKLTAPGNKQLKVTWKKYTTASGYNVQIATNKQFTKGKKSFIISKNTTISKTITKLKKGTKYYVRVRAFVKVNGKRYYGKFSAVKAVKVK